MKIIKVSNFGKESFSDQLIATEVSEYYGKFLVNKLINEFSGDNAPDWFRLVPDDYKLYEFKP